METSLKNERKIYFINSTQSADCEAIILYSKILFSNCVKKISKSVVEPENFDSFGKKAFLDIM